MQARLGRQKRKGTEVKTLVFALMLETLVDGYVDTTKEFGVFQDIDHCTYFGNAITRQGLSKYAGKLDYEVPYKAYCIPKYVDSETTVIFKR
jgi:hypothetical protein|tara:strand:- start:442 stop:717 length:276 start_codon:yes stop_codon:yes gene_type:complete